MSTLNKKSVLNKIESIIGDSHDEFIMSKKWDVKHKSKLMVDLTHKLYPFWNKYYFEGNPSFLNDYLNFLDMERFPLIQVRDGLVQVAEFFLNNFKPPGFLNTIFLLPKEFEAIVPEGWRDQVAFYHFEYPTPPKVPGRVLVAGSPSDYSYWRKTPEQVFKELRERIPAETKIDFFFPVRERLFFPSKEESGVIAESFKWLHHFFGADAKILTKNSWILTHKLGPQDAYCELVHAPYLISDGFFEHWYASQNVPILGSAAHPSTDEALSYDLSPYHKVKISAPGKNFGAQFGNLAVKAKLLAQKVNLENPGFHKFIKQFVASGELGI